MAFRRMRRRGGPRRAKTKVLWDRAATLIGVDPLVNPVLAQVIGDPRLLPGSLSGFDMLRTVRRIVLNINSTLELDVNSVAQGSLLCGVYVGDRNAPVLDPLFNSSDDLEGDWMDLWMLPMRTPATGVQSQAIPSELSPNALIRDIRVNRKLDNDDVIIFCANVATTSGAMILSGGTVLLTQSLLWTATPT